MTSGLHIVHTMRIAHRNIKHVRFQIENSKILHIWIEKFTQILTSNISNFLNSSILKFVFFDLKIKFGYIFKSIHHFIIENFSTTRIIAKNRKPHMLNYVKHGLVEIYKPKIGRNVSFYESVEKITRNYNFKNQSKNI